MEREICGYIVDHYLHDNGLSVEFEVYETNFNCDRSLFLTGYVKWDGCSNWNIPEGNYQLHFCGRKEMEKFTELLQAMFDWAAELMPNQLLNE